MAKDNYFDLRQSTRAYQNPYEAGGIGVGGLTESARYNRQQVGSSFLSAPSGTSTWSPSGSRTSSRGGMVNMPTDGPTPLGGAPDRPQRMGPAGPPALAGGVAGRFERPSESTWAPTGESGKSLATALSIPIGGAVNAARNARARREEKKRLRQNAAYDAPATLARKRQNLPAGRFPLGPRIDDSGIEDPTRPVRKYNPSYNTNTNDLDPVLNEDPGLVGPGHWDFADDGSVRTTTPFLSRYRDKYDPNLTGSGQGLQDINLEYGLPTAGLPELGMGSGDEYPARNSNVRESLGKSRFGPQREPTGSPIEMGAVPAPGMTADVLAGQPRALPAGTQRRVGQRVDEPQAPGPGPSDNPPPVATRQTTRARAQRVKEQATATEYPASASKPKAETKPKPKPKNTGNKKK
jgi:hypothetical protein